MSEAESHPEVLANSANIAASTEVGGPIEARDGPITTELKNGGSYLMSPSRMPLDSQVGPDGQTVDLMAQIQGSSEGVAVIRYHQDGSYAIARPGEGQDSQPEVTNLDPFGNKSTSVTVDGVGILVNYEPNRSRLDIRPAVAGRQHEAVVNVTVGQDRVVDKAA